MERESSHITAVLLWRKLSPLHKLSEFKTQFAKHSRNVEREKRRSVTRKHLTLYRSPSFDCACTHTGPKRDKQTHVVYINACRKKIASASGIRFPHYYFRLLWFGQWFRFLAKKKASGNHRLFRNIIYFDSQAHIINSKRHLLCTHR